MTTLDGPTRFLQLLRLIADDEDKLNSMMGVGLVLRTGRVLTGPPNVTVAMDGETSMGGPMVFDDTKGDLLVPYDFLLAPNDLVVLAPMSKRRWSIVQKIRPSTDVNDSRNGYNG